MDIFSYGLMLGAGFVAGAYAVDFAFIGLKKLIGRYISFG